MTSGAISGLNPQTGVLVFTCVKQEQPDRLFGAVVLLVGGIGMPLLVWFLARFAYPSAILEGPFVFMSPFLAISLLVFVLSLRDARPLNLSVSDLALEIEFNEVGERLGLQRRKVFSQPEDGRKYRWPIAIYSEYVLVYLEQWRDWDPRLRDFMLAYSLAYESGSDRELRRNVIFGVIFAVAGSFLACINLWLILPLHSIALGGAFFLAKRHARRNVIAADARALQLTMDYGAAQSFVEWNSHHYKIFGSKFSEARGEALAAEAVKLRLIAVNTGS